MNTQNKTIKIIVKEDEQEKTKISTSISIGSGYSIDELLYIFADLTSKLLNGNIKQMAEDSPEDYEELFRICIGKYLQYLSALSNQRNDCDFLSEMTQNVLDNISSLTQDIIEKENSIYEDEDGFSPFSD